MGGCRVAPEQYGTSIRSAARSRLRCRDRLRTVGTQVAGQRQASPLIVASPRVTITFMASENGGGVRPESVPRIRSRSQPKRFAAPDSKPVNVLSLTQTEQDASFSSASTTSSLSSPEHRPGRTSPTSWTTSAPNGTDPPRRRRDHRLPRRRRLPSRHGTRRPVQRPRSRRPALHGRLGARRMSRWTCSTQPAGDRTRSHSDRSTARVCRGSRHGDRDPEQPYFALDTER